MGNLMKRFLVILMVFALMLPVLAVAQTEQPDKEGGVENANFIEIVFDHETVKMGDTLNVSFNLPVSEDEIQDFYADWYLYYSDGTSAKKWCTDECATAFSFDITEGVEGIFYVWFVTNDGTEYYGDKYITITGTPAVDPMSISIKPDKSTIAVGETVNFDVDLVNFKEPLNYYYSYIEIVYNEDVTKSGPSYEGYTPSVSYTATEGSMVRFYVDAESADGRGCSGYAEVKVTGSDKKVPSVKVTPSKSVFEPGDEVTFSFQISDYEEEIDGAEGYIDAYDFAGDLVFSEMLDMETVLKGSMTITVPEADNIVVGFYIYYCDGLNVWSRCEFDIKNSYVPVLHIEAYPREITVGKGQKNSHINVAVYPEDATDKTLVWKSADEKIATVNSKGVIKGVGKGTTIITATSKDDPDVSIEIEVKVVGKNKGVKKIKLDKKKASLKVGKSLKLKATLTPANAADKSIVWYVDDTGVITVNQKGKVTAVAPGKATVYARASNGQVVTCDITVKEAKVTKITIEGKKKMKKGDTQQLTVIVKPDAAANKDVKWKSSNPKVATVDKNGVVTAIKKGKVTITATAKDGSKVKAKFEIKVKK